MPAGMRDLSSISLEDGEQRDKEFQRAVQAHASESERAEMVCQLVGATVQFGIGERELSAVAYGERGACS